MRYSPALIEPSAPNTRANRRKRPAEGIAPARSNSRAAAARLLPSATCTVTVRCAGPLPPQLRTTTTAAMIATSPSSRPRQPTLRIVCGSDRLHDQRRIGAAEAERIVQHRLHLASSPSAAPGRRPRCPRRDYAGSASAARSGRAAPGCRRCSPPHRPRRAGARSPTWCSTSTRPTDRHRTRASPRRARSCRPWSRCHAR